MATSTTLAAASRPSQQHSRLANMAAILAKEFGSPFALFDATRPRVASVPDEFPLEDARHSCFQLVHQVALRAKVELSDCVDGWQLVGLPLWKSDAVSLVAVGAFRAWSVTEVAAPTPPRCDRTGRALGPVASVPPQCLERWAQAVSDRQRLEDQLRCQTRRHDSIDDELHTSVQMLNRLDRLAAQLSVSDRPDRFQKIALASLFESLAVEALAWVPANPADAVATSGETPLNSSALRRLVLEATAHQVASPDRARVDNRVQQAAWGADFVGVRSVAVVSAADERPSGWLVAINKSAGGFHSSDIAMMKPAASLLHVCRRNSNRYLDLKELLFGVVRSLASAIDAKDPYTRGHSERVARIAVCLGRQLKLGTDELSNLYLAGLLHDIGKIGVPDEVLKKDGPLTPDEYKQVMRHVEIGTEIIRELKRLRHVLPAVLHHHERFAGGGYPTGIAGDAIPFDARILAVADSFDAMSSDRPYRRRRSPDEVQSILRDGAGKQWDPKLVEAALACWGELSAIQSRGLGESLRIAVDDAMQQESASGVPGKTG